jgi:hypothetical protein
VEGEPPDDDARVLQRKKANYAARQDELRLRWKNGCIEPEATAASFSSPFGRQPADVVFLSLLDQFTASKRAVSESPKAGNFAPRVFGTLPIGQRENYREADFRRAMEQLFASRSIENVHYGRTSDKRRMFARVVQL